LREQLITADSLNATIRTGLESLGYDV
jgi:hypothetical protein